VRMKARTTSSLRAKLRSTRQNNDFTLGVESQTLSHLAEFATHRTCSVVEGIGNAHVCHGVSHPRSRSSQGFSQLSNSEQTPKRGPVVT